MTLKQLLFG